MRYLTGLLLLVFLVAILLFALQNQRTVEMHFLNNTITLPLAAISVASYILGMLSGWSMLRYFRRSVQRVHEIENR
jgi:lipopolysaccharide assembly protein A